MYINKVNKYILMFQTYDYTTQEFVPYFYNFLF